MRQRVARLRRLANIGRWAFVCAGLSVGGCGATLPEISLPAASQLVDNAYATTIVGRPDEIYQRIAQPAARCWFGPFGRIHTGYMMHADLPPSTSSAPVTVTIHRRLPTKKKPWGPSLLRLELTGTTTTTLSFANIGLKPDVLRKMTRGMTRWANGRSDCGAEFGNPPADDIATGATGTSQTAKTR